MLRRAMQHEANVVGLAWHLLAPLRFAQAGCRRYQLSMTLSQVLDCLPPRGVACIRHGREVFFVVELERLPLNNSRVDCALPGGDVQHQLPNAVRFRNWTGRCSLGVNARDNLHQSRPVPRFAFKRHRQFFDNLLDLGHGLYFSGCSYHSALSSNLSKCVIPHARALKAGERGTLRQRSVWLSGTAFSMSA